MNSCIVLAVLASSGWIELEEGLQSLTFKKSFGSFAVSASASSLPILSEDNLSEVRIVEALKTASLPLSIDTDKRTISLDRARLRTESDLVRQSQFQSVVRQRNEAIANLPNLQDQNSIRRIADRIGYSRTGSAIALNALGDRIVSDDIILRTLNAGYGMPVVFTGAGGRYVQKYDGTVALQLREAARAPVSGLASPDIALDPSSVWIAATLLPDALLLRVGDEGEIAWSQSYGLGDTELVSKSAELMSDSDRDVTLTFQPDRMLASRQWQALKLLAEKRKRKLILVPSIRAAQALSSLPRNVTLGEAISALQGPGCLKIEESNEYLVAWDSLLGTMPDSEYYLIFDRWFSSAIISLKESPLLALEAVRAVGYLEWRRSMLSMRQFLKRQGVSILGTGPAPSIGVLLQRSTGLPESGSVFDFDNKSACMLYDEFTLRRGGLPWASMRSGGEQIRGIRAEAVVIEGIREVSENDSNNFLRKSQVRQLLSDVQSRNVMRGKRYVFGTSRSVKLIFDAPYPIDLDLYATIDWSQESRTFSEVERWAQGE